MSLAIALRQLRPLMCLCALLALGTAKAQTQAHDLDFDFSALRLVTPQHDRMTQPTVTWEVSLTPQRTCQGLDPQGTRQYQYSQACVVWNEPAQTCHFVLSPKSSHSQMGHLLLACMRKPS